MVKQIKERLQGDEKMKIIQRSPDPFYFENGEVGILLIHGFTGTPSEMRPLGEYLAKAGFTVHAPLLAGHGTCPEDLEKTDWQDWLKTVLDAYDTMVQRGVKQVFVAGLSMGGLLAFYLSLHRPVAGLISLCAPIWVQDRRAPYVEIAQFFIRYLPRKGQKSPEIEQFLVPYDRTPLRAIAQLMRFIRKVRKRLSEVQVPTLVIQAKNDETIVPESANYIYQQISSKEKRLSWYEKSSHIITLDRERGKLFEEIESFISEQLRLQSNQGKE